MYKIANLKDIDFSKKIELEIQRTRYSTFGMESYVLPNNEIFVLLKTYSAEEGVLFESEEIVNEVMSTLGFPLLMKFDVFLEKHRYQTLNIIHDRSYFINILSDLAGEELLIKADLEYLAYISKVLHKKCKKIKADYLYNNYLYPLIIYIYEIIMQIDKSAFISFKQDSSMGFYYPVLYNSKGYNYHIKTAADLLYKKKVDILYVLLFVSNEDVKRFIRGE